MLHELWHGFPAAEVEIAAGNVTRKGAVANGGLKSFLECHNIPGKNRITVLIRKEEITLEMAREVTPHAHPTAGGPGDGLADVGYVGGGDAPNINELVSDGTWETAVCNLIGHTGVTQQLLYAVELMQGMVFGKPSVTYGVKSLSDVETRRSAEAGAIVGLNERVLAMENGRDQVIAAYTKAAPVPPKAKAPVPKVPPPSPIAAQSLPKAKSPPMGRMDATMPAWVAAPPPAPPAKSGPQGITLSSYAVAKAKGPVPKTVALAQVEVKAAAKAVMPVGKATGIVNNDWNSRLGMDVFNLNPI